MFSHDAYMKKNYNFYQKYIFPLLKNTNFESFDPEIMHTFHLHALHMVQNQPEIHSLIKKKLTVSNNKLNVNVFGLKFANPIGVAAGFDKNGIAIKSLSSMGFGAIEVGTITPLPQYGKDKYRLFRLDKDNALINRFGFSNDGANYLKRNLKSANEKNFVVGVNIGPNTKTIEEGNPLEDYSKCITQLHDFADYFTINISSPNTKGLRNLQSEKLLDNVLTGIFKTTNSLRLKKPILIKISPDLTEEALLKLLDVVMSHPVAGIIAVNTTLDRPKNISDQKKKEEGGLSGMPLKKKSTEIIKKIHKKTNGKLPIIGAGGVFTASDAIEKIEAGATLVQLYTGLFFEGPEIVKKINLGLLQYMEKQKIGNITEMIGKAVK